jgi:valyl-tRNA synthetase
MAEISKAYDPSSVETKWYDVWEKQGAFKGQRDESRDPFAIMIPPPNVTGMLHMGHILNNTLQDMLVRRARLEGKAALWQPGMDHAGIATQTKVEKEIRKDGLHRRDLGREKFIQKVWEWKEKHGGIILNQLKKLGASCDWDRTSFTLDESYQNAVLTAFVTLYKRGYIYRGLRMSNWCPVSLTALSNEEVVMKPQKSKLWKMRYELVEPATAADGSPLTHLEISTTRPETIMGDTAVAVHPKDERYKHLIGKMIYRPFPKEPIPIVGDEAVEKDFGTGCLKVTPAHDQVDFDIGKRHNLPTIDVLNPDATLNELAGEPFVGMDRFAARKLAAKMLEEQGLLVEVEEYDNNVGFSERADVPIEPRLTEQWWLRYPKVDEAKRVIEAGIINFHPKRWENVYLHWLNHGQENNIDWCLSRQLWWGHRIPVWYKKGINRSEVDLNNPDHIHVSVEGPNDPENWEQEEDVLDTWASSWLWPFATLGWPDSKEDLKKDLEFFYPTSVLATGFDIIFLWVARMIMAGLEFMGEEKETLTDDELRERIPFKDVYVTGLIRDEKGRKMSKSLGNSPDPLDLIAKYGADGVRFGIINIAPSGQDILFSEERIEIGRNFCNKLWNACRFRQMSGPSFDNQSIQLILNRINGDLFDDYDHWILSRLLETNQKLADNYRLFECNQVTHVLYEFFWSDFCDTYVEVSKSKLSQEDLKHNVLSIQDLIIRQLLLMLEPLTPHITEELWSQLGYSQDDQLLQQNQIEPSEELETLFSAASLHLDKKAAGRVDKLEELISKTRALKAEFNLGSKRDVSLFYKSTEKASTLIEQNKASLLKQIGAESLEATAENKALPASVSELGTVYLDLTSSVDPEAEKERLQKEIQKIDKAIMAGESKLKNEKFMSNAPPNIVEGAKAQLAESVAKKEELTHLLVRLG